MSDLIGREKAINTAHSMRKVCDTDNIDDYHDLIVAALNDLPPSDVVEVVRCKDCKYADFGECTHKLGLIVADDENYCSYGVRKDDQHQ